MKWSFSKPIKVFWSIVAQKNVAKTKEKVCWSTWEISKNKEILKHMWWEVIQEKLMFRMLWHTLKDGLCYLWGWKCIYESFPSEHAQSYWFYLSGQAYVSFKLLCNLLRILNFFHKNYWPRLTSSSKCRGSINHGEIKFWFSGNANTGRHCYWNVI